MINHGECDCAIYGKDQLCCGTVEFGPIQLLGNSGLVTICEINLSEIRPRNLDTFYISAAIPEIAGVHYQKTLSDHGVEFKYLEVRFPAIELEVVRRVVDNR